jgi:hypothetical protein
MKYGSWLLIVAAFACGESKKPSFPTARFVNAPPVTVVDDRRNVPTPPKVLLPLESPYGWDVLFKGAIIRAMELPRDHRARGVSSIDDVPDSTWFTNRPQLTPAQVRTGPVTIDNPELHLPWTIHSTSYGGSSNAFIITDARGVKYLLKFDDKAYPEMETGIDVVVNRLMWASGFNVPEDQVVYFRPEQLCVAPDAVVKNEVGDIRGRLDRAGVDKKLALVAHDPDGRIRGMASRWIDGKALGGTPSRGVRKDDPNDRIPHQMRRDLRGMYAIYAWVDNVDIWPGNLLDMWIADPTEPNRHYVKHYLLDFGLSFALMGTKMHDLRRGHSYVIDGPVFFASLGTAGIKVWPWENRPAVDIPGVPTLFSANDFDPGRWYNDLPFEPFKQMDRVDAFWGAKIVAQFTRGQIHAAVEAGRFTDPRAVEYITNTLVARQRKTAEYWYARVNPLDNFTASDDLCFDDLAIEQGYVPFGAHTMYSITPHDFVGHPIARPNQVAASLDGHTCTPIAQLCRPGHDGYTILQITTTRPGFRKTTYVHVARDPNGAPRVIGVWRV